MRRSSTIRTLVECAMMIALATVLSLIKVWKMPFGGSITIVCMLPICLIANKYGTKIGLVTAFGFSLIQFFLDMGEVIGWGLTPLVLVACILLDYLVAFTMLGFAGVFRKYGLVGNLCGIVFALFLRFLSHFASGVALWGDYAAGYGFTSPWIYSLAYNGSFIGVEIVTTVIVAFILFKIPVIRNLITLPKEEKDTQEATQN